MLDLQLFSEETDINAAGNEHETNIKTPEEIQAQIDSETEKLRTELEQERKKRAEAERLSKLSEDERREAELESTRRELEEQRREFEREKIKFETAKVLSQRGLPVEFTDYLLADDAAKTLERIATFEKTYRKGIEAAVNERLKGKAPPISSDKPTGATGSAFMRAIYDNQIRR